LQKYSDTETSLPLIFLFGSDASHGVLLLQHHRSLQWHDRMLEFSSDLFSREASVAAHAMGRLK
jgi:hypothetical protein